MIHSNPFIKLVQSLAPGEPTSVTLLIGDTSRLFSRPGISVWISILQPVTKASGLGEGGRPRRFSDDGTQRPRAALISMMSMEPPEAISTSRV